MTASHGQTCGKWLHRPFQFLEALCRSQGLFSQISFLLLGIWTSRLCRRCLLGKVVGHKWKSEIRCPCTYAQAQNASSATKHWTRHWSEWKQFAPELIKHVNSNHYHGGFLNQDCLITHNFGANSSSEQTPSIAETNALYLTGLWNEGVGKGAFDRRAVNSVGSVQQIHSVSACASFRIMFGLKWHGNCFSVRQGSIISARPPMLLLSSTNLLRILLLEHVCRKDMHNIDVLWVRHNKTDSSLSGFGKFEHWRDL